MFNLNKSNPGYVPVHFIETVLEFTMVGNIVEIKSKASSDRWQVEPATAAFLLFCSYKDYEADIRLLDYNEAERLLTEGKTISFAGFFPYDQIVLQQYGVGYSFYRDHSARKQVTLNNEIFYLCLVRQKDYPIGPSKDRPADITMLADTDADDWSFSDDSMDWNDWDDSEDSRNKRL
jgi:hypothetical protein